ncbi:F-box domain-containing protein [Colletotrichum eremochloae]|nr:F-box domain-containing protein [Colletotrichum eremochloae]
MSAILSPIDLLPNELLIAILSTLDSRDLLPLTLVDRRFSATATTILQHRLLHTAKMEGHNMMLDSYHPIDKQSTPSMTCRFTGLSLLNHTWTREQEDMDLRDLSQFYSHFVPVVSEETRRMRRVFGRRLPGVPLEHETGDEPVTQEIILDEGELFSQLCTSTSLIKSGPNPGLLASHRNITHGVVRVWRHWLAKAAAISAISPTAGCTDESTILWLDSAKNVGLRFRVTDVTQQRLPPYRGSDEDPPVAYSIYYQELLVRTSHVLLALEQAAVQEVVDSGKATIIISIDFY